MDSFKKMDSFENEDCRGDKTDSCCSCCNPSSPFSDSEPEKLDANAKRKEWLFFLVCFFYLTLLPIYIFSEPVSYPLMWWFLFSIPYFYCGYPIFLEAYALIQKKDYLNEFTLMCGATVAAILLGELPEAVGVMVFYRLGEYAQDKAVYRSRASIRSLLSTKPESAWVLENESYIEKKAEEVKKGDILLVRVGEKVPVDAVVLEGQSELDQSALTGESLPIFLGPGEQVLAGSINKTSVLRLQAEGAFQDSHMARIAKMVESAAAQKSPTERFISRIARYYTPTVVALAVLVALVPPLLYSAELFSVWLYRALVLLVISCPCALLISIPLGYFGGIGAASRLGILVKGGNVFDALLKIDTVAFDKTGTLTYGAFGIMSVHAEAPYSDADLLIAAARIEQYSQHPLAQAIVQHAQSMGLLLAKEQEYSSVEELAGRGLVIKNKEKVTLAGNNRLIKEYGFEHKAVMDSKAYAIVHIVSESMYLGYILLADTIKEDSYYAVKNLQNLGKRVFMLTGDAAAPAKKVAETLGIKDYKSGLLPEDKVDAVKTHKGKLAFVGDGINDAPLLALADVGIAMGGKGADIAVELADVVIMNDSPAKVYDAFLLATRVRKIVWQNIFLALGIKSIFICLGVFGLSSLWEAVFADVGVALLAVLNANRAGNIINEHDFE